MSTECGESGIPRAADTAQRGRWPADLRFRLLTNLRAARNICADPPIEMGVTQRGREFPGEFADVLIAAQAGEPLALRELFDWLSPAVAGFLRSRGAHDPDGFANEVFLRAFRTIQTFSGDDQRFRTWVFTITRNLLIDERRAAARRVELVFDDGRAPGREPRGDAEADALTALGDERVAELLAHLSPDQREVIALRVIADLSVDQVAAITGRGYEAVKALHRRGIAALRRAIEREGVPR